MRRSSPAPEPFTESAASGDLVHMPELQPHNPRKRRLSEQPPSHLLLKKRKFIHPSGSQPPRFWDNLSKVWLTKRALRELDRRNTQAAANPPCSLYPQQHRPVTRQSVAEWQEKYERYRTAAGVPSDCTPKDVRDIKLFARHGGPDLSDLTGYRMPANPLYHGMSSSQSIPRRRKRKSTSSSTTKATSKTTTTKSTGPYDRAFEQNLIDGGVYPHAYRYPDGRVPPKPKNWDDINQLLAQPRPSLSPSRFSEEEHEKFVQADAHAFKEKQITTSVIPIIEGEIKDAKCVSGGIPLGNLDHLTDGTLKPGNPDLYYGARPEQLDRRVRTKLSEYIEPSTQKDLPITPNFFLAVKGPDGTAVVAKRQACYDGALGARGMYSVHSHSQNESVYDNNAYTITSSYSDGQLKMYTTHPIQSTSARSRPEYIMTQIKGWSMTSDPETFRQGASFFRNGIDWARERRDEAIRHANVRADEGHTITPVTQSNSDRVSSFACTGLQVDPYAVESVGQDSRTSLTEDSVASASLHESETSMDELALDFRRTARPRKRRSELVSNAI